MYARHANVSTRTPIGRSLRTDPCATGRCNCISFCRVFVDCLAAKRLTSVYRCLTYCVVYRRPRFPAGAPKSELRAGRSRASPACPPAQSSGLPPESGASSHDHTQHVSHDTRHTAHLQLALPPRFLPPGRTAHALSCTHTHTRTHRTHAHARTRHAPIANRPSAWAHSVQARCTITQQQGTDTRQAGA